MWAGMTMSCSPNSDPPRAGVFNKERVVQERTYSDGRVIREIFNATPTEAAFKHAIAAVEPGITKVVHSPA